MPIVVIPANVSACQIEIPAGIERSQKGALYVRPASSMEITSAELEHIKVAEPVLFSKLITTPASPSLEDLLTARAAKDPELKAKLDAKRAKNAPPPVPPEAKKKKSE